MFIAHILILLLGFSDFIYSISQMDPNHCEKCQQIGTVLLRASDQKFCETCWKQTGSPGNQIESLPSCENIEDDQEEDLDYSYRFSTPSFLIQSHTVPESRKTLPLTLTT